MSDESPDYEHDICPVCGDKYRLDNSPETLERLGRSEMVHLCQLGAQLKAWFMRISMSILRDGKLHIRQYDRELAKMCYKAGFPIYKPNKMNVWYVYRFIKEIVDDTAPTPNYVFNQWRGNGSYAWPQEWPKLWPDTEWPKQETESEVVQTEAPQPASEPDSGRGLRIPDYSLLGDNNFDYEGE